MIKNRGKMTKSQVRARVLRAAEMIESGDFHHSCIAIDQACLNLIGWPHDLRKSYEQFYGAPMDEQGRWHFDDGEKFWYDYENGKEIRVLMLLWFRECGLK